MKRLHSIALALLLVSFAVSGLHAADVKWPTGPVTIVSPSKPGGFADVHARVFADYLQRKTGIATAVVNMADGGGTVGYDAVRKAKPDGLKLMYYHTTFPIGCYTGQYKADPEKDFTPIADVANGGNNAYVVRANAPWKNLPEFLEDARKNPGKFIWGVQIGGTSHFMQAMFEKESKAKFKLVDAGSEADKLTSLLGGFIDIANVSMPNADQYVKAGKLKALMITGETRDFAFPSFPTAIEQGVNVVWNGDFYLYGPPGMSRDLAVKIHEALKDFGTPRDQVSADALKKLGSFVVPRTFDESIAALKKSNQGLKDLVAEIGL